MTAIALVPDNTAAVQAVDGIAKLQQMLPPKGFAFDRWALIQSDCARLLEQHGDDMLRLGWSITDVFGSHPTASAVAIRCYGLGLLLNGGKVVEITGSGATIEMRNGTRQTFVRTSDTGAVPIWTAG